MKKLLAVLLLPALLVISAYAQASTCRVQSVIYDVNNQPRANFAVEVVKVTLSGQLFSNTRRAYRTNSSGVLLGSDGVAGIELPQGSVAWIYADMIGFNADARNGTPVQVPNTASEQLVNLARLSTILTTLGDTLYAGQYGVPSRLAGNTSTANKLMVQTGTGTASAAPEWWSLVAGANVTITPNTTNKTFTISSTGGGGGGGSLTTREVDGSPVVTTTILEFNQADGLVLTDQTGGTARLSLSGIPQARIASLVSDLAAKAAIASLSTVATSGAYSDLSGRPTLGTAAALNVPASGDASSGEVVKGSDSRLTDARTPTAHTHAESEVTNLVSDLALLAPKASPALTGTPTAPTAAGGTNTTQIATTAFVQAAVAGGTAGVASFNGRTGIVVPATNDYTWAQVDKTTSSLADLATRSASDLNSGTLPLGRLSGITNTEISGSAAIALSKLASGSSIPTSITNDTNVTGSIASNVLTIGWTGTLAKARLLGTVAYTDQANTFGAFVQTFQGGANHLITDTTDTTKKFQFDVSNVATSTTRTVNVPNANSTTVQADTGASNNFLTAISAQGVVSKAQPSFANISGTATAGQLPSTAVNSVTNDTNVTGSITAQALTLGWTGTLAKARQNGATVYNDAGNTFSTGAQDFGSATSLKIVTGAGAAPTANGLVAYDSTANAYKFGVNGSAKTVLMTDGSGASLTSLSATALSGTVAPGNGGTGQTAATLNGVLVGGGTVFGLSVIPSCSNGTTDKLLYNNSTQTFTCGSDQTGAGGGGITTLNTLTGTTQTFSRTNDTNVTMTLTPSGTDHNFALGWTGTLAVARGGIGVGTLTGIAKGNGTSAFTAAVAGTDYEVPLTFGSGVSRSTNAISLDQSFAPTMTGNWIWSGVSANHKRDGIGTTNATAIEISNNTAAAAGAQQQSPDLLFTAQGWKTTATAASQAVSFRHYLLPVQGTTNPSSNYLIQSAINGGAWTTRLQLNSDATWTVGTAGTSSVSGSTNVFSFAAGGNGVRVRVDGNPSNATRRVDFNNTTARRFSVGTITTEPGSSNGGSDFVIEAYSDADALLSTPFKITRSSGQVALTGDLQATTATFSGAITVASCTGCGGGSSHNMLSATHTDSTVGTVARGDLITGQGGSPTWTRLAIGAANRVAFSDGTDVSWSTVPNAALANSSVTIGSTSVSLGATASTVAGLTLTTPTITGGTHTGITGLGIRSSGTGAFDLNLINTENLTAARNFTVKLNDAARTLDL
ncbi:MAG: hypothetical protein ABI977_04930, partial [Acidobacteriota bacterium]